MTSRFLRFGCLFACCALVARAAPPPVSVPQSTDDYTAGQADGWSFRNLLNSRTAYLGGDLGGLRTALGRYGITLAIQETDEDLGNVSGGFRKGFDFDGLTTVVLQADSQRALGYYGGTFQVSALDLHGDNLSADNLGTLQTASGIEGDRALRLWELWYQQKFLPDDRLDIKIGEQSLDQEFMVSQNALVFVNTMFGWPMVPSADLPGGGPAYPLAVPGLRFRVRPNGSWTVLAGVFNGTPDRGSDPDSQRNNRSGTQFPVGNGLLAIAEVQYAYPGLGTLLTPGSSAPLARVIRLGMWYDSEQFSDLEYDTTGHSLADPASNGQARLHRGDYSFYGVLDQMIWEDPEEDDRTLNFLLRPMGTPQGDRNLVSFSLNAGLVFHEPFLHRDDDTFAIGYGYAKVGSHASGLDQDTNAFGGTNLPVRSGESFLEVTYQYAFRPWCQFQPDIQFVHRPGGGIPNDAGTGRVGDEVVVGLRINIQI